MRAVSALLALIVALATLAGCASSQAPAGYLPNSADEALSSVRGGWAVLELHGGGQVSGELLAIGPDTVHVLSSGGGQVGVPRAGVVSARVEAHGGGGGAVGMWGALGTLSTLSHGFFAVLSAPIWLLTTAFAAPAASRVGFRSYPRLSWEELSAYARFPQGLPSGYGSARPAGP